MRATLLVRASTFAVLLTAAACGGKPPDPKAPDTSAAAGAPSGSPTSTAEPAATAPPTTTTATLGNTGDQSTKIPAAPKGDAPKDGSKKGQEPGRAREDIQAIIVARRDEARACYDEGLKKNPSIEGDLDIKWTIDPDGNVTDIAVDSSKSTIRDDNVGNCIIAIIKKVKFAKSNKGFQTTTHYPFNFHPKAGQVGKGGAQGQPQQNP